MPPLDDRFLKQATVLQQVLTSLNENEPESTSPERLQWLIHSTRSHIASFSIVQQGTDLGTAFELSADIYRLRQEKTRQQEALSVFWSIFVTFPFRLWQALSSSVTISPRLNEENPLTPFFESFQAAELDAAVERGRERLKSSDGEHIVTLASSLFVRFNALRQMQDLEETISHYRQAIHLPLSSQRRLLCLNTLSAALLARYVETSGLQSLYDARSLRADAIKEEREQSEYQKFVTEVSQEGSDGRTLALNEAVSLYRQVLALRPPPHPHRAISLHNLATSLHTRFKERNQREDLDEAIQLYREALGLLPGGHPDRETTATYLHQALSAESQLNIT